MQEVLQRPAVVVAMVVGVLFAGALAVVKPLLGLGVALLLLLATLIRRAPVRRIAQVGIILTAVAAIAGPNVAVPGLPWLFAFRILIVALGLGLVGFLLMDGRLEVPGGLARPAALLIALFVWSALSIGWAADPLAALRWTTFLGMMGGLAIGIGLACSTPGRARKLLIVLAATFVVATLIALAEIRLGFRLPTSALLGRNRDVAFGATSLFGNQNNFATYLTLTLPYFLTLPVVFRDVRLKTLGCVGAAATLIALLFTGSRSNLLASGLILLGLIVVLGLDRRSRVQLVAAGVVGALAVLLVVPSVLGSGIVPLPQGAVTKFNFGLLATQREAGIGSGAVRGSLLSDGLDLVKQTNGLGVGAGNAEDQVRALANFPGAENLHNWWLEVLVDLGVVGFALFVAFYLSLLRGQLKASRQARDPMIRWLGLSGGLSLIGFIVGSLGPSSVIHFGPMWITFGLGMLTLGLAGREAARRAEGQA